MAVDPVPATVKEARQAARAASLRYVSDEGPGIGRRRIGKVIGRRGRVARAMRTLLKVSAIQNQKRAILEID